MGPQRTIEYRHNVVELYKASHIQKHVYNRIYLKASTPKSLSNQTEKIVSLGCWKIIYTSP